MGGGTRSVRMYMYMYTHSRFRKKNLSGLPKIKIIKNNNLKKIELRLTVLDLDGAFPDSLLREPGQILALLFFFPFFSTDYYRSFYN